MTSVTDRLDVLASAIARAAPDMNAEQERIALSVYRSLAQGAPMGPDDIAEHAGASTERVQALLRSWPGVFLDNAERVVGFWGLTILRLSPTHRLEMNGRELFAWCAWDTLFLPELLSGRAVVESSCPVTGETISLVVSPSGILETSHPGAVVSFLLPERDFDSDIVRSFCHFIYFFSSRDAGEQWTSAHPGTFLLSLGEAFDLGSRVNHVNFPTALDAR